MISFTLVLSATLINPVIPVLFRILPFVRIMSKSLPPAIPFDSPVSVDGQRFFLVDGLTVDPFSERIVVHYRRPRKYELGGQIALCEQESKKTV